MRNLKYYQIKAIDCKPLVHNSIRASLLFLGVLFLTLSWSSISVLTAHQTYKQVFAYNGKHPIPESVELARFKLINDAIVVYQYRKSRHRKVKAKLLTAAVVYATGLSLYSIMFYSRRLHNIYKSNKKREFNYNMTHKL